VQIDGSVEQAVHHVAHAGTANVCRP
jgi:hypothetical protein